MKPTEARGVTRPQANPPTGILCILGENMRWLYENCRGTWKERRTAVQSVIREEGNEKGDRTEFQKRVPMPGKILLSRKPNWYHVPVLKWPFGVWVTQTNRVFLIFQFRPSFGRLRARGGTTKVTKKESKMQRPLTRGKDDWLTLRRFRWLVIQLWNPKPIEFYYDQHDTSGRDISGSRAIFSDVGCLGCLRPPKKCEKIPSAYAAPVVVPFWTMSDMGYQYTWTPNK